MVHYRSKVLFDPMDSPRRKDGDPDRYARAVYLKMNKLGKHGIRDEHLMNERAHNALQFPIGWSAGSLSYRMSRSRSCGVITHFLILMQNIE